MREQGGGLRESKEVDNVRVSEKNPNICKD
jgi:hypothetical protein